MQRGQALIFLLVGIVVLAIAGGAYYLGRQTPPKLSPVPIATSQTPQSTTIPSSTSKSSVLDINGFPVYPGAILIETKDYPPCTEGQYSGYSICNAKAYTWQINANSDQVSVFYRQDQSKSGWICSGGGGSYDDMNNASGTTTCKKGNLTYGLFTDTKNGVSKIILSIPKGTPTGK